MKNGIVVMIAYLGLMTQKRNVKNAQRNMVKKAVNMNVVEANQIMFQNPKEDEVIEQHIVNQSPERRQWLI